MTGEGDGQDVIEQQRVRRVRAGFDGCHRGPSEQGRAIQHNSAFQLK